MIKIPGRVILLVLASIFLTCGCGSGTSTTYPVVVFSDVHFNPFYDETLFQELNSSEASEWAGVFEKSSITVPSTYGADSNYPLLVLALESIEQNLGTSPVIIFTGDVLGHNFAKQFYDLYGSEDVAAMQVFASKTVDFFTRFVKSYVGDIPVMFVLGNADSYTGLAPDTTYFSNTAEIYYSNWIGTKANHQAFLSTYEAGGYYSAEPFGKNLVVIALNTVALSTLVLTDNDSQVRAELRWLDSTLASAKSAGKKVWLLMHVTPGAYTGQTASQLSPSGHLSAATMQLKPNHQTSLLQVLSEYSGIITIMLGGHTHMDEFRNIFSTLLPEGFLMITPGITPYFNNNPAYKIYTFPEGGYEPTDYKSINYNLATLPTHFNDYYTFGSAYFDGAMSGFLGDALAELSPLLNTDRAEQRLFRTYYYSGSSYSSAITDANWKVYWCAITKMTEEDLINCVNSY